MFDADWWYGSQRERMIAEAKRRAARRRFAHLPDDQLEADPDYQRFLAALEARILIYLRDGYNYELKEIADIGSRAYLTFECNPPEEQYRVGSFVLAVPFDDIVRVEVFAVHPDERPPEAMQIAGFRAAPETPTRDELRPER